MKNLARGVRVREGTMGALPRELGPGRNREPPRDFTNCETELSVCPGISMGKKAEAGAGEMVLQAIQCLHVSARTQVQFLEP